MSCVPFVANVSKENHHGLNNINTNCRDLNTHASQNFEIFVQMEDIECGFIRSDACLKFTKTHPILNVSKLHMNMQRGEQIWYWLQGESTGCMELVRMLNSWVHGMS